MTPKETPAVDLIWPSDPRHPPQDIIDAAAKVSRWFAERHLEGWQLGAVADRSLVPIRAKRGTEAAPAACPFTLPLSVGTQHGRVSDQIFDAKGQAVLILYGVDSRGSLEEARSMEWNQKGLARGDYVVKAVNEHEGLVKRVAAMQLTLDAVQGALDDAFDGEVGHARSVLRLKRAFDAEAKLCEIYKTSAMAEQQIIAKPVDRRKDRCSACMNVTPRHAIDCPNHPDRSF